mgnify:CR=1 FL=1
MQILEALVSSIPQAQLGEMIAKYESERIGVGGSTGDADVDERSQDGPTKIENPGSCAAQLEQAIHEKAQAPRQNYLMLGRKLCEHIKRNQISHCTTESILQIVNEITGSRRPEKAQPEPQVNNSPFGGFAVRKPAEGAVGMA